MTRALGLLFAILCYAIFFATFLYFIAFVGDFLVPKTVDAPLSTLPKVTKAVIDVALIALFGLQHSIMARPTFKRAWTRVVPRAIERSVYVLFASIALIVLFLFWQPLTRSIWQVAPDMRWLSMILWAMFWGGFGIVLISTFLINHFELFGLQQTWLNLRGRQAEAPQMCEPALYRLVRHPMMVGFFFALWATPAMTAGHLLFAAGMSVYILIALHYEERDLVGLFGADYESYRGRVGMLVPRFRRRSI
jgi:protein-S-isoprenylcysteine O-methyltransferase Ste14